MVRYSDDERLDLAVALVTEGLDDGPREELWSDTSTRELIEDLERAAAALHMALTPVAPPESVPVGLQQRIYGRWNDGPPAAVRGPVAMEPANLAPHPRSVPSPESTPGTAPGAPRTFAFAGWFVAAAALALCVVLAGRLVRLSADAGEFEPRLARERLLAEDPNTFELAWVDSIRHSTSESMKGSVVWSDERNEGYMTFDGLESNDPTEAQYQLWIFRGTDLGAEPHPIDGGVFDVGAGGEVVVPIDPKLQLDQASSFVVTLEKPGGVVVSDRSQIVAVAQRAL